MVLKIGSAAAAGTFDFTADDTGTATVTATTTTAITTGTFSSLVGTATSTGTWRALDVGNFALWNGTAATTGGTQTLTGFSTPDSIYGVIVTKSTTNTSRFRILQILQNTSIFYGQAVTTAETPTMAR